MRLDAQVEHTKYPDALLSVANSLIEQDQYGIAVVVAHMACEVATESAISEAFVVKKIQYLEDAVTEFYQGNNLGNDRIRKLYTALTGDDISKQPFWSRFKSSADRRNKVIHTGAKVRKEEAEESWKAASELVAHLHALVIK